MLKSQHQAEPQVSEMQEDTENLNEVVIFLFLLLDGFLSDRLVSPLWSVHPEAEAAGGGARP